MFGLTQCSAEQAEQTLSFRAANLPWPSNGWGLFPPREKRVSRISVWRYVRAFVRNNHYSGCDCNRIGGFARDDSLPQHLAAASQAVSGP